MKFWIKGEDGQVLDAAVELEQSAIILFSRGGTSGTSNSQNQDYPTALRLILQRLEQYGRTITGAWVDSIPARSLPLAQRQILFPEDASNDAKSLFSLMGRRMEAVGRSAWGPQNKGNRNKRLRIEVTTGSIGELSSVIAAVPQADVPRAALRLPASDLRKVTATDIWAAIEQLESKTVSHDFGDSLDYDLIAEDGNRLPPKAVFGLAASAALGFPVQPGNFTGGLDTVAFELLKDAGWDIIDKDVPAQGEGQALNVEDRQWAEGDPKRVSHLRRERHPGLVKAKKAEMYRIHGKLFCERCQLDPVASFGTADGEACIEVHHRSLQVSDMVPGQRTRLSDVECLCANCHRVTHRQMKARPGSDVDG